MNWRRYPTSRPRRVEGGIRAQSRRGSFADGWWAKRWIQVVESSGIGARLGRGRNYARSGQVLDLEITEGSITAGVQGSRSRPYDVQITVDTLSPSQCEILVEALSSAALYTAELLAGSMPEDIEDVFAACGLSLFPADVTTSCSCPDWSNPCKHIAAVFYLVGEELDRDPMLLLTLRGINPEDLLDVIESSTESSSSQPLPDDLEEFWGGSMPLQVKGEPLLEHDTPGVLLRALGKFPLWRGEQTPLKALDPVYAGVRREAQELLERLDEDME